MGSAFLCTFPRHDGRLGGMYDVGQPVFINHIIFPSKRRRYHDNIYHPIIVVVSRVTINQAIQSTSYSFMSLFIRLQPI